MKELSIPVSNDTIRDLRAGDSVSITGTVLTGRDVVHSFIHKNFITNQPAPDETDFYAYLKEKLNSSFIYHCGPVIRETENGWECVAGGPTTSIREEPYQADIIKEFNLAGVIGKGGMGQQTADALKKCGAVYISAVGGAAAVAASSITNVSDVHKQEFGMPEAVWEFELEGFPGIVTMDSFGNNIHADVLAGSQRRLEEMLQ